jgi:hypothetical protein
MNSAVVPAVGKVSVLTVALYVLLCYPTALANLGIARPEASLFLDTVLVPNAPHLLLVLSWWKVIIAMCLTAGYAIAAVVWVRRRCCGYPETLASLVVFVQASLLIILLNWMDLASALHDRCDLWSSPTSRMLVQFVLAFPGGASGQTLASIAVQILLTVATVKLFGMKDRTDRSDAEDGGCTSR